MSISFMQDEIRPLNSLNLNHNLFKLQLILLYDYSIIKLKLMLPHKNKCIFYHRFKKKKPINTHLGLKNLVVRRKI